MKYKEELKAIMKSKRLKVSGIKEELLDRLEKADKGQAKLMFHINVPQSPRHPASSSELPVTPQKRRHRDEEEVEEEYQPSLKEAKLEGKFIEHEGGGEAQNLIKLTMGGEGNPMKEEKREMMDLMRKKSNEAEHLRK